MRLAGAISGRGSAVLAAHLSADGTRVLHVFADPGGDAALDAKELAETWKEGRARVDVAGDPSWSSVAPFLT
jgi:hypothetical protein